MMMDEKAATEYWSFPTEGDMTLNDWVRAQADIGAWCMSDWIILPSPQLIGHELLMPLSRGT